MKYAIISDGKLYIEDDRWVTIRGNHVLIKGSQEEEDISIKSPGKVVIRPKEPHKVLSRSTGVKQIQASRPKGSFDFQKTINSNIHLANLVAELDEAGVAYDEVRPRNNALSEAEIIKEVCGGDKTQGSCFSVALAYIGQKFGFDVHDFRGGKARFNISSNCDKIIKACSDGKFIECKLVQNSLQSALDLLQKVKNGKEYLFSVGKHTAIIRKENGKLQYLDLQDSKYSGWLNFEDEDYYDTKDTLKDTFGCVKGRTTGYYSILIDTQNLNNEDFRVILGYINTKKDKQRVRK